jgi:hypothetical protein
MVRWFAAPAEHVSQAAARKNLSIGASSQEKLLDSGREKAHGLYMNTSGSGNRLVFRGYSWEDEKIHHRETESGRKRLKDRRGRGVPGNLPVDTKNISARGRA